MSEAIASNWSLPDLTKRTQLSGRPHEWFRLAAVAAISVGFYLLVLHFTGRSEAWDDGNYNIFLLLAAMATGALFNPARPWLDGIAFSAAQLLTAYFLKPVNFLGFLAMGSITFCLFVAPYAIGGTYLGRFLRRSVALGIEEFTSGRERQGHVATLRLLTQVGFLALAAAAGVLVHWLTGRAPRDRMGLELSLAVLLQLVVPLILVLARPQTPWLTAVVFCFFFFLAGAVQNLDLGKVQPGMLPLVILPPPLAFILPLVGAYLGWFLRTRLRRSRSGSLV
jgi:hypothetical protein